MNKKKPIMGIDFGSSEIKFAIYENGSVKRMLSVPTLDNLVKNGAISAMEAMTAYLKEIISTHKLNCKQCAVALPGSISYTRYTKLPAMTVDKLDINLPYEFRDYITSNKEKYIYDYAVVSMPKDPLEKDAKMELMACAALKDDMIAYEEMLRKAGLKPVKLIPNEFAYRNLISGKYAGTDEAACLIDLGHNATRVYIFKGDRYEVTKIIEHSGATIDSVIADKLRTDIHLAKARKESGSDSIIEDDVCVSVYRSIALDITRTINFYNYEMQDDLSKVFVFGGGTRNAALMKELKNGTNFEIIPIDAILPPECQGDELSMLCPAAIGSVLRQEEAK